jgi:hypothetical protein
MRSIKSIGGFSLSKTLLIAFLLFWSIGAIAYLTTYIPKVDGSYTEELPTWISGCSRDPTNRMENCTFASWVREVALHQQANLANDNMNRQVFIWHHIASVVIFFVVIGAFVLSMYFAYLEFIREGVSPTDPEHPKLTAKFLGMEFSSSMIGLSILVVSFAFFMAYVSIVYPIKGMDTDSAAQAQNNQKPNAEQPAETGSNNVAR